MNYSLFIVGAEKLTKELTEKLQFKEELNNGKQWYTAIVAQPQKRGYKLGVF